MIIRNNMIEKSAEYIRTMCNTKENVFFRYEFLVTFVNENNTNKSTTHICFPENPLFFFCFCKFLLLYESPER